MRPGKAAPLALLAALGALGAAVLLPLRLTLADADIPAGDAPATNPMKGLAAWGENYRKDPYVAFAYVPVYWDELEPRPGEYDFDALEQRCHFDRWRADGVRLILRLVADTPTDAPHMDIPQWLYEAMDGAGTHYDGDYGQGFSPDYEDPVFRQAHRALIQALGQRYADDPQVAFIELGSLGHWGEWHVDTGAGIDPFPLRQTAESYVQDYLAVFRPDQLLMRRPYPIARDEGLGLYNDSFGLPESHEQWLAWIEEGYCSDQTGEWLPAMPEFWQQAPSGGEFSPGEPDAWYFSPEQFPVTLDLLRQSHTTFLGPNAPAWGTLEGDEAQNLRTLVCEMGYTLGVRRYRVWRALPGGALQTELRWENTGLAPLYADWPVVLELRSDAGEVVWCGQFPAPLSDWGPGVHTLTLTLEGADPLPKGAYTLWVGIWDPLAGRAGVALCMDAPRDGGMYRAARFVIS